MTPRILILDNCLERIERFNVLPQALSAVTEDGCIGYLTDNWDYLFLGYGMSVVEWIVEHRPKIGRIIVYTLNEDEGQKMVSDLHAVGYWALWVPFTEKYLDWIMPLLAASLAGDQF